MSDAQNIVASASPSLSSSPTRPAHGANLRRVAGACVWAFAKVAELREGGEDCLLAHSTDEAVHRSLSDEQPMCDHRRPRPTRRNYRRPPRS